MLLLDSILINKLVKVNCLGSTTGAVRAFVCITQTSTLAACNLTGPQVIAPPSDMGEFEQTVLLVAAITSWHAEWMNPLSHLKVNWLCMISTDSLIRECLVAVYYPSEEFELTANTVSSHEQQAYFEATHLPHSKLTRWAHSVSLL